MVCTFFSFSRAVFMSVAYANLGEFLSFACVAC